MKVIRKKTPEQELREQVRNLNIAIEQTRDENSRLNKLSYEANRDLNSLKRELQEAEGRARVIPGLMEDIAFLRGQVSVLMPSEKNAMAARAGENIENGTPVTLRRFP